MSLIDQSQSPPPVPEKKPGFMERVQTAYEGMMKRATDTVAGVSYSNIFFQPGQPYRPAGPDDMIGRSLDYPTNYNVNLLPRSYETISFPELRLLAEFHDITRLMIETRKDQVEALNWTIKPSFEAKTAGQKADMLKRAGMTQAFLEFPDGVTGFSQWMRMLVEDILVIDAPTIWVDRGDPLNTQFKIIDGASIKIVIDEDGRIPPPPSPAYQQIIKGMPAWNYTADDLIYMPRNPRPGRIYGMSPVQQIVITVNICLRRQASQLQYFTDGNIPDALIATPESWTPEQIIAYQKAWDSLFEGQTANRRRAKFVPGGVTMTQTKEAILKDAFDEWLLKICAFAFSIPASAFIAQVNRATAQTAKAASEEEGLAPLLRHLKRIIDTIVQKYLGQYDLEFDWADKEETDAADKATIHDTKIRNGSMTINEARNEDGKDPIEGGDVPFIMTSTGPVPVASLVNLPVEPPPPPGPTGVADRNNPLHPDHPDNPANQNPDGTKPPTAGKPGASSGNASSFGGDKGEGEQDQRENQTKDGGTGKSARPFVVASTVSKRGVTKPLYVRRPLLNAGSIIEHFKNQGFETLLEEDDMHVTQVYSKQPVSWDQFTPYRNIVTVGVSRRSVHQFDGGATVMRFESFKLRSRFGQFRDGGCSFDYDQYKPHITLTYAKHGLNLDAIEPYPGELIFGPEIFEEINDGYKDGLTEKAAPAPCPVHGHAHVQKAVLRRDGKPVHPDWRDPLDSAQGKKTEAAVYTEVSRALKALGAKVVPQIVAAIRAHPKKAAAITKAGGDDEDEEGADEDQEEEFDLENHYSLDDALSAAHAVNLDDLNALATDGKLAQQFGDLASFNGNKMLARVGANTNDDLVNQFNRDAYNNADDQAADLVGMKWVDGELVENPNPKWSITSSTRDMIHDAVTQSFVQGYGIAELQTVLQESAAFSESRARMVARTESLRAANDGVKSSLKRAQAAGVNLKKTWLAAADSCDDCIDNEDDGPIDMDDTFTTGDDSPPAHPNCRCSLSAEVGESGNDSDDDDDEDDDSED